jgi:hypothetical protein
MTPDEAIRWAREAGFNPQRNEWVFTEMLEHFATLAYAAGAAAERAACIDDCNAEARDDGTAQRIVERIQARGNT